jgi:DNA-binding response OmpR family regulator
MVKPFEMKELLARIKALHKRSQYAPHENILKVEDLEVNLKTKQVMRAGNTIDLTPKEFNLLTYMLNNKGRVLSKSEIAEKVWDTKFDTGTNFIDVYISYLRRKIDKDYSKKLIQTKNGMGYILISHENPD